ncbi:MAG: cytochrome c-type biogenesis protein CcmH [Gammaproteobacteria bacterium]|nr:MAG: cytochrome c-type biogenesis protein CcmH [Gammaproteobacteria bacterium]
MLSLVPWAAATNIEAYDFDSPQQERDYKELTTELRCLVCQNQDIADSNAELAQDMRHKVYRMLKQGKTKQEIVDFMVRRYGDFVRYKPPFDTRTLVLWVGPFLIFALAIFFMLRAISRARRREERAELSEEQINRAADLLEENPSKSTD